MNFRTTAIAAGLATLLGTGAAFAQSGPNYPPPPMEATHHHHHHHGVLALIQDEVAAGRISHKEGALLVEKIRAMKAERRAERQARYQGMQGQGGNGNYPPPPPPSQRQPDPR